MGPSTHSPNKQISIPISSDFDSDFLLEVVGFKVQGFKVQGFKVQKFRGSRFKFQRFKVQGFKVQKFKVQPPLFGVFAPVSFKTCK